MCHNGLNHVKPFIRRITILNLLLNLVMSRVVCHLSLFSSRELYVVFLLELIALTLLGMEIHMRGNTLRTRCMGLGYIVLQMVIDMKEPGMRAEGKDLECIHLEMVKPNLVTGKVESLTFQAPRTRPIQFLLSVSIILKYSMRCRYILYVYDLFPF